MFRRTPLRLSARSWLAIAAAILVTGLALTLMITTGASRSVRHLRPTATPTPHASRAESLTTSSAPPVAARVGPTLSRTDDPASYARDVTSALFDVDFARTTRADFLQFWRGELPTVVYSDAASKGLTLAVQNNDAIDNLTRWWIPTAAAWSSEAADLTTGRIAVTSITVPDYWANAVADGTFRDPGLHVDRVMGVLTQTYGRDEAQRHTSTRPIVIDLALLCGPTQPDGCRLVAPQPPPGDGTG